MLEKYSVTVSNGFIWLKLEPYDPSEPCSKPSGSSRHGCHLYLVDVSGASLNTQTQIWCAYRVISNGICGVVLTHKGFCDFFAFTPVSHTCTNAPYLSLITHMCTQQTCIRLHYKGTSIILT